jgi:hypothetical protein
MKVVRLSTLSIGRLYLLENIPVLISVRGRVNPKAGRIISVKNSKTLSGIDPATFRLVAQCLNQLRHRETTEKILAIYFCVKSCSETAHLNTIISLKLYKRELFSFVD